MRGSAILAALLLPLGVQGDGAVILDAENFETAVHGSGKSFTFVKFLAPW